jgi:hypothetical protein
LRDEHSGVEVKIVDEQGFLPFLDRVEKPTSFDLPEVAAEPNEIDPLGISKGVLNQVTEGPAGSGGFGFLRDHANIVFAGYDLGALHAGDEGRRRLLVVEQRPDLFDGVVEENGGMNVTFLFDFIVPNQDFAGAEPVLVDR